MEWVETVAKTVEAAKSAALDRLGVGEDEAEFEVISTPKPGLFGRVRGEARVRARVRPTAVRPKAERRRRPGKNRSNTGEGGSDRRERRGQKASSGASDSGSPDAVPSEGRTNDASPAAAVREDGQRSSGRRRRRRGNAASSTANNATPADASPADSSPADSSGASEAASDNGRQAATRSSQQRRKESTMSSSESGTDGREREASPVSPDQVAGAAVAFLEGLAGAFGVPATGTAAVDGTDIEVQLNGDDLGLLIGPAGGTLHAVQDLTRVVAQRKLGDHETRLRVDVAQYRERRRAALEKFAQAVSEQVVESQRPRALEPMSSADRKIIHDAVQTIEGVDSTSDGSEPNRRVVIRPAE